MYPPQFDYYRASSIDEALELLERHADDDPRILAGGHSLLPDLKNGRASPGVLVDIGEIESLRGIEADSGAAETAIGALTTYADLLESERVRQHTPVLTDATAVLADLQIRNRGTIGGNLAAAEPGADLPAATLAAGAAVRVRGPDGERAIDAADFLGADGSGSAVGEQEREGRRQLVTEIRVPHHSAGGYAKKTHPASGYAMVGVAAVLETDDDDETIADARVAATGVLEHAVRLTAVEDELVGGVIDAETIETAAARAGETIDPTDARSDDHASGEFRVHLLSAYAERALEKAIERLGAGSGADLERTQTDGGERR